MCVYVDFGSFHQSTHMHHHKDALRLITYSTCLTLCPRCLVKLSCLAVKNIPYVLSEGFLLDVSPLSLIRLNVEFYPIWSMEKQTIVNSTCEF